MDSTCNQEKLTRNVLEYQSTGKEYDKVYGECALAVYDIIQKYRRIDEDTKSDFFLHFHPTLVRAISRFRHSGVTFTNYLKYLVRRRLKTFLGIQKRKSFLHELAMSPSLVEDQPHTSFHIASKKNPLANQVLDINETGKIQDRTSRNRFLCYAFKRAYDHGEQDICIISKMAGMDASWIREKLDDLKSGLSGQEERLLRLAGRRNRLFVEVRGIEHALLNEHDRENRSLLYKRLHGKNRTLSNLMTTIAHVQLSPSHLAIGNALGLPKGTVDVMLFRLKQRLAAAV